MRFIKNTNTKVYSNPECKGYPVKRPDGTIIYKPIYKVLDEVGMQIGETLFED
jgi:hypothetical protein|nr:MAG TPA: hypothetical protein [Caudoviricetes sp.]